MLESELNKRQLLLQHVNALENELCNQSLWQSDKPSPSALMSRAPFAIDTLTFPQWLQFIFIYKIRGVLQFSLPLPKSMSVAPMAEEFFKNNNINSAEIINIITDIDILINDQK